MTRDENPTTPFLIPRSRFKNDEVPEYEYSHVHGVNLVKSTDQPLAEDNALLVSTQSKTDAEVETDDPDL